MIALAVIYLAIGALLAGITAPDDRDLKRIAGFAVMWWLILIAAVGWTIGRRLGT